MKRLLSIVLMACVVYGCTSILDKPLLDEISEETYWQTPTDMELYINQFYVTFRNMMEYYHRDNNSDNMQPVAPNEVLDGTRSVPASGGGWNWADIRKVNYFLNNAGKVTEGTVADREQYIGEGYFFRAYFYFIKVQRFGAVPWFNKVLNTNSEELYASRVPRSIIVDSIISDLDKAIGLLQEQSKVPTGRLNKGCALLLKSRVCLYEGTWEKYHAGDPFGVDGSDGQKYLELAAEAAGSLIQSGNYQIYSTGDPDNDYFHLFNQLDLTGNPEVLLFQTVDPTIGLGSGVWTYLNGTRGNATGITRQLVQDYLCTDGKPISISTEYKGDTTLLQAVENRDPRLSQTMWVPGQIQLSTTPNPVVYKHPTLDKGSSDMATTGYMVRKGSTTDPEQNTGSSSDDYGKTDGIVFRYAEALLNYAEARAELNQLTQEDLDQSINLLRDRVGMPHLTMEVGYTDPDWSFPNLSPILNEIRRERRVELAMEGFRYHDLMRWAAVDLIAGHRWKGARFIKGKSFPDIENKISDIATDDAHYIDRYQRSLPDGFGFDEKRDYLFPIPTTELSLNKNLDQNPGW